MVMCPLVPAQLFDEMMDFGYPQSTEPKILKEYITQARVVPGP